MPSTANSWMAAARDTVRSLARWCVSIARVLAKHGPMGAFRYSRLGVGRSAPVLVFGHGLTSDVPAAKARRWFLAHGKPVVVALFGDPGRDVGAWIDELSRELEVHVLLSPAAAAQVSGPSKHAYSIVDTLGGARVDYFTLKDWSGRLRPKWDLLIVDAAQTLVDPERVIRLQHAAYNYDRGQHEIGFVSPALVMNGRRVLGYEWDCDERTWISRQGSDDHGQDRFSRYVLAANAHGLYATHRTLEQVRFGSLSASSLSLDEQVRRVIAAAWQQNIRTLAFAPVELHVDSLPAPMTAETDLAWLTGRNVVAADGRRRIIFVLAGTSISGGIRTVFEQAEGFTTRGFAVEIWALEAQPDWLDLHVTVKTYKSYFDMIPALRNEDAIKVATWWETAEVVWLGSVTSGIGVNYVQEFETWFYPDDAIARAAVASSYRSEMKHLTIATFQQAELEGVGIASTYIPSCYDAEKFHELPDAARREGTMMAVGRSFFQKNFSMTLAGWRLLGEGRPRLSLFGFEPDLVLDDRVVYETRPSDERVNELYNEASFFVQTSLHEGFSLPLIEAMAAGCPVITTDSHGNRDFCRDGENCIVVPQDDPGSLSRAITSLMADPELRSRLAEAGKTTALAYTQDAVFPRLEAFYNGLS